MNNIIFFTIIIFLFSVITTLEQQIDDLEQQMDNSVHINKKSVQGSIDTTDYPLIKFKIIEQ